MKRMGWMVVWLVAALGAGSLPAAAADSTAAPGSNPGAAGASAAQAGTEAATFAGGCFWCMETAFEGKPGVISVISGYSGGDEPNPTYEDVSAGRTGHYESVQVVYDPKQTSYAKLLDIFWHNIDPTQDGGQFCDHGAQYRSAIFAMDAAQSQLANESLQRLAAAKRWKKPAVTPVLVFKSFWPAEEYHQDYYRKNPDSYKAYRLNCGRDRRLKEVWGRDAPKP